MSSAFVKEDIDVPERIPRWRSASGLPPGAVNFMTEEGALKLRQRVAELKKADAGDPEGSELEGMLESATVVKQPERPEEVVFGVRVTLQSAAGELVSYRIAGVDEVQLEPCNVSWVSALGRALLGAKVGERVSVGPEKQAKWTVVKIE
ncbi:MAG: GreA/GreB family elongation factor [Prosthecobacter sp.]|uniref:GreA/GreB family elongation factor n=1 Tax=Prosthecobacter sp. TaxID=1965333 RepID=UPI0025D77D47|nr:GreA/GreB family elongation factor [Prosthecobacter sp.]MCF7785847.1 GreA/GreB family elongation factor [Prosthecobacter sp.]